ncbi:unnamed protein product [Thlaspi arvense]|uniref:UDP-glucose 4-epimerase n=1 Tax=Thlaspi arvense TaxID=13288 RepID=A0AAU9SUX3_THLAR|nr:unnamed protein product [Thlaspi arvense]
MGPLKEREWWWEELDTYNLGTCNGTSVLEMVTAFEKAGGKKIPVKMCPARSGDATAAYAAVDKAEKELGWKAKYGIEEMCKAPMELGK